MAPVIAPLKDLYPPAFPYCLVLKIGEGGSVQRRPCCLALGVTVDGERDVLPALELPRRDALPSRSEGQRRAYNLTEVRRDL
jgi:transposase-like protein